MDRIDIPPKAVSEIATVLFDFTNRLSPGTTITGAQVLCNVQSGVDPVPLAVLDTIAHTDSVVSQVVKAGVPGVIYELVCGVSTSDGLRLMKNGYLSVVPGTSTVTV